MRYIKEFDTLRFFAVTLVIISHSFPNVAWVHKIPLGMIGVSFFFVLSGKLITSILLYEKNNLTTNLGIKLKTFYIRRALRIFPAYYLFLFLVFLLGNEDLKNNLIYYLSYFQNILFFKRVEYSGALSPTWTLAVEEQFYLLWPLFILIIASKRLYGYTIAIILLSPLFRIAVTIVCKYIGQSSGLNLALMPSNLICLCSGALLAYVEYYKKYLLMTLQKAVFVLVPLVVFLPLIVITKNGFIESIIYQILISVVSVWLLNVIANNGQNFMVKLLNNKVANYLGKISYGLYLYHTIAIAVVAKLLGVNFNFGTNIFFNFIIDYLVLILFASVSWFLFEKPISNLKKYFCY